MQNNADFIVPQYLMQGAENAIKAPQLVLQMGLKSQKVLRYLIAEERERGALVLSSSSGYYLPSDGEKGRQEIQSYIASMEKRARSIFRVLGTAKQQQKILEGQQTISEI